MIAPEVSRRTPMPRWALPALVVLIVAVLGTGYVQSTQSSDTSTQLATAAGTANDLAATIAAACASSTIPAQYAGACSKARAVQANPIPGPAGAAGVAGAPGADGRDGTNGLTPTCYYTPAQCVGPSGSQGPPGSPATGAPGVAGVPGPAGPQGEPGAAGPAGPQGVQGPPGPPGCDAGTHRDETGTCVADVNTTPATAGP